MLEEQRRSKIKERIRQLQEAKKVGKNEDWCCHLCCLEAHSFIVGAGSSCRKGRCRRRWHFHSNRRSCWRGQGRRRQEEKVSAAFLFSSRSLTHTHLHVLCHRLEEEEGEDPAEAEAKRRRKLQVLQLLSGTTVPDSATASSSVASSNHPIRIELRSTGGGAATAAPATSSSAAPAGSASGVASGRKFGMTSSALDEDDDDEPRREIVLLTYTEEELREMEAADQSHANANPLQQRRAEEEESLEEEYRRRQPVLGGAMLKGLAGSMAARAAPAGIAPEIHQRVLAQAHLISQSLNKMLAGAPATGSGGVATALAASGSSSGGGAAGVPPAPTASSGGESRSAASSAVEAVQAAKRSLEQIVDQIPTEKLVPPPLPCHVRVANLPIAFLAFREALFAFTVNWDVLDRHDVVRSVLKAWIVKKIVQYLGEEEESLTHFIVSKLSAHCSPQDLVQELSMVLDEDSDTFVCKLWRMVVYYSLLKSAEEKDQRT